MLERRTLPDTHAISIILKDHDNVRTLFDQFEKAETGAQREKIIAEALTELKVHAVIEEEIFYRAIRTHVGKDLMNEADEEHHVARVLIAELELTGWENDHRMPNSVLAENVRTTSRKKRTRSSPRLRS